jgi:hypothetical protein
MGLRGAAAQASAHKLGHPFGLRQGQQPTFDIADASMENKKRRREAPFSCYFGAMGKRRRPWKVGDVYAIAFADNRFAYFRLRKDVTAEFFDFVSTGLLQIDQIDINNRKFAIMIDRTIFRNESCSYLGVIPCEDYLDVNFFWQPRGQGSFFLFESGYPRGRTEISQAEALQYEPVAVWSDVHILQRLADEFPLKA